jgi:PTS system mannose-specific IIA component
MTSQPEDGGKNAARFGVLVVAHGDLPGTLVKVVEKILGAKLDVEAVSVGWDDDMADSRLKIQEALKRAGQGRGVLILTDMFGGTPTNVTLPFLKAEGVEIVTGVNLPMMVKVPNIQQGSGTLAEAADRLRDLGQAAIQLATHYLKKPPGGASPAA